MHAVIDYLIDADNCISKMRCVPSCWHYMCAIGMRGISLKINIIAPATHAGRYIYIRCRDYIW